MFRYVKSIAIALLSAILIFAAASMHAHMAAASQTETTDRFNMSYIYFGNTSAYTGYVDAAGGSLDHVAPSYFDLNKDGTLKLTGAIDKGFIDAMHNRGIKVTPFLSNHWDRESGVNALNNAELLALQIAEAVTEYDLDGVDVDIENMTETERDKYTAFVKILRQKLPSGKSVSVAVAPNPYKLTKGWHASYDLAALQQHCDYLMLMTYDQHYQGYVSSTGGAGPVAGYGFVEESIKAALKEVPAKKLVLGIPFYGRLWKQGAAYGGYGISNNTVESLVSEFKGKVIFDDVQKSPKAVITIKSGDRKPIIFGTALEAGTYDIWYENEASIKAKLELVKKYGLKGTGSWSLGQETKETWSYYSLWLNGRYFSDIQQHWAKDAILEAMDNGWMEGLPGSRFEPESPMTRAQAAALLVRVLGVDVPAATGTPMFVDTAKHWARKEIEAAAKAGLFQGVGGGRFDPDKELTREQMAVILDRLLGGSDTAAGESGFTGSAIDIAGPAADHTEAAGITRPAADFTKLSADNSMPGGYFADVDPSVAWSYGAIGRMTEKGFLQGFPDGTFRPKEAIKRGQMAVFIGRTAPYLIGD
jgi:spore germination protein YaaH